jgi:uncharacterized membrane protein (Fun14 family)
MSGWLLCRYSNWLCLEESNQISSCNSRIFLAALAYLQSQQIANINWNKLQTVSEGAITTLSNAIIIHIPGISGDSSHTAATASASLSITSFDIPLTGSMSAGFTIGFIKG